MNRLAFLILFLPAFLNGVIRADAQKAIPNIHSNSIQVQKPVIDTCVYKRWTHVEGVSISNNGAFISYVIRNDSMSSKVASVVTDKMGRWMVKLSGIKEVKFTADSRSAAYLGKDTLFVIRLGSDYVEKIPNVQLFYTSAGGKGGWICFKYKTSDSLITYNTHSGLKKVYSSVKSSYFTEDGKSLVLQTQDTIDSTKSVSFLDLNSGRLFNAWKGKGTVAMQMNAAATLVVFVVSDSTGGGKSMWIYERGESGLDLLVNNAILKIDNSWLLDDYTEISISGKYIYFSIRRLKPELVSSETKSSTVRIWSYLDAKLQSLQLMNDEQPSVQSFVMNRDNHHITKVCKENESVMSSSRDNDTYIVEHVDNDVDGFEAYWNSSAQRTYYLKSIKYNKDVVLNLNGSVMISVSPEGKYAIYYDKAKSSYFVYEVLSGACRNITLGLNTSWNNIYREDMLAYGRGICGWGRADA
ncbi:hypothetical protein, partial [Chitinophaga sp.]|uniref:hypothetical protein n=1 Tax=Chitinophaga sp. TaxID=1869181 RepID=UPI002F943CCA